MPKNLVAEIMDLTVRQGFDIQFTSDLDVENVVNYFIILISKGNYYQKITIDIDDLRPKTLYSMEDYIVNILNKARNEIITEIEKGKRKEE